MPRCPLWVRGPPLPRSRYQLPRMKQSKSSPGKPLPLDSAAHPCCSWTRRAELLQLPRPLQEAARHNTLNSHSPSASGELRHALLAALSSSSRCRVRSSARHGSVGKSKEEGTSWCSWHSCSFPPTPARSHRRSHPDPDMPKVQLVHTWQTPKTAVDTWHMCTHTGINMVMEGWFEHTLGAPCY